MWDFFKHLSDKVKLTELTVFIIFLLLAVAALVPRLLPEVTALLQDNSPQLLKSWFHFGDLLNIAVALVLYLSSRPALIFIKNWWQEKKQRKLLESLDDDEIKVVYAMMANHFQPKVFDSSPIVMTLVSKNVLTFQEHYTDNYYYCLTPAFQDCFLKEFRKSCDRNT